MNFFTQIFSNYAKLFGVIGQHMTVGVVFSIIFFLVALGIFLKVFFGYLAYMENKSKYLIKKNRSSFTKTAKTELMKIDFFNKILKKIAIKIGMVSEYAYERNLEIATNFVLITIVIALTVIFFLMPGSGALWYITLFYICIGGLFVFLLIYVFFAFARMAFIKKLPDTYKILNSRYISKGNILKAINQSLEDFDKVTRREMMKIYNVLKKNDMREIESAFKDIEVTYNTEYLTILLSLIKQAHFKGGNEMIKEQFETVTEEILEEIENQRDLSSTSRSYIGMAIFLPVGMLLIERFNNNSIGEKSAEFYLSPMGTMLKIILIVAVLIYIGMLLFMEKSV